MPLLQSGQSPIGANSGGRCSADDWLQDSGLASKSVNLDFDARVPIPFSIFPSTYRNETQEVEESTTQTRVETEINKGRVGREDRYTSTAVDIQKDDRPRRKEEVRIYEERDRRNNDRIDERIDTVEFREDRRDNFRRANVDIEIERERRPRFETETEIDITERQARRQYQPTYDVEYTQEYERRRPREEATKKTLEVEAKMGYYDDEGQYHSFRRGIERATDRLLHPFHGPHRHEHEEVVIERDEREARGPAVSRQESVRYVERGGGAGAGRARGTVTIPCHFIRIGDLLILQGRPCQVIRITTSSQTGQHRYLGVDLFSKKLYEESSFLSNPSPSTYVQNMLGPVFKEYRVLDIGQDGHVTAMTESGDVKQTLPVIDHGSLWASLNDSFADGRGSVRVLVINDGGRELAVDYKVIHGSRL